VTGVGVVVIGRNEKEHLERCLRSVDIRTTVVVYVDSGSSDGSLELARAMGVEVLELDPALPFSAGRACNAGWQHLSERVPDLQWVQFLAGDCELVHGWLERGRSELTRRPDVAVVCGRLREESRGASVYNRLADMEWDAPVGEDVDFAGLAMLRLSALRQVGGFNAALIAGEEPELCLRLRRQGWKTLRLGAEMARHDMRMSHWTQWWRRSVRTGYGYAEGAWLHGQAPERFWVHESLSIWFWGLFLPVLAWGGALLTRGLSLFLLLGYPALTLRIVRRMRRRGCSRGDSLVYALSCVLAKFPQLSGQMRFLRTRVSGQPGRLIEYK
jgi:GT2 family glycosyltransferase